MNRRIKIALSFAAAGSAVLAAVGTAGAGTAAARAAAVHRTDARPLSSLPLRLEGAPAVSVATAEQLAMVPRNVDPVAENYAAARKAKSLPAVAGTWRNVGPTGAIIGDAGYATQEGRLPTTGIVLSIALDPRDATGGTAYVGTGGGVYKTTDGGAHWAALAVPAVPVGAVGLDKNRPDDVYVATGQAFQGGGEGGSLGVYVSHDAGRTFVRPAQNVRGTGGQQVSVSDDGTVFVATSGGLFRSTDHGASFQDVLLPTNAAGTAPAPYSLIGSWTSDVQPRPGHPNEVDAAVGYVAGKTLLPDGTVAAPGNGLYRSTEGGAPGTWHRVDVTSATTGWEQEPLKSSDPIGRTRLAWSADGATLYALVADAGHRSSGVAAPVDGGAAALGLPNPVHPTSLNGLYRSTDGGATWALKADSADFTIAPGSVQPALSALSLLGYNAGIQAWYNGWVQVDPNDADRVLVGEEEVYQSVTPMSVPGVTPFQSIDSYFSACNAVVNVPQPCLQATGVVTHPDQHGVALLKTASGSRLWIGNDGGVFRQDSGPNGFAQTGWVTGAHLNELLPYRAVEGPNGEVIAGLQDNGTVLYPPGSNNSYEVCGGDGTSVAVSPTNPKIFYCMQNGSLAVTTDGGQTIASIGSSDVTPAFLPAAFAMDPTDENHLVIGGNVIEESTKGAATMGQADPTGLGLGDPTGLSGNGDWVTVFSNGSNKLGDRQTQAVAVRGADVYAASCAVCASSIHLPLSSLDRQLATNVGKPGCTPAKASTACWHVAQGIGMPTRQPSALAIDPANVKDVVMVTQAPSVERLDLGGDAGRVIRSTDAGDHFTDISGDLPVGNVYDAVITGGRIYVAHDQGVFSAPLTGQHWSRVGTNLPLARVYGLSLSSNGKDLVASTYGRGVWLLAVPKAATKPAKKPTKKPEKVPHVTKPGGSLAATGVPVGLGVTALLLVVGGLALTRRHRRTANGPDLTP
ncbi:MAG TPA: hypothetical protein VHE83_18465 [Mycobacteriales bacterium]|nr:hypothetical protein [Mycobacteriales bacterium]